MKISHSNRTSREQRRWADSARPFSRQRRNFPVLGVNKNGVVYAISPKNAAAVLFASHAIITHPDLGESSTFTDMALLWAEDTAMTIANFDDMRKLVRKALRPKE